MKKISENSYSKVRFINQHARPVGTFLAISAGVMFATNGTLIKVFAINFLDAVLVRCLVQTIIFGLVMVCLGLCSTSELRYETQEIVLRSKYILWAIISLQVRYLLISLRSKRIIYLDINSTIHFIFSAFHFRD